MASEKPIHCLVLDAGPIIKNSPAVSTLLAQSDSLFTIPAVVSEIRDAVTRARIATTLLPFLTQRDPRPESVKIVQDFARRTGDLAVLSKTDIQLIALARELECESNGGDWRLRNMPGQKRTNGPPPPKQDAAGPSESTEPPSESTPANGETTAVENGHTESSSTPAIQDSVSPSVPPPEAADLVISALADAHISDEPKGGASSTRPTSRASSTAEDASSANAISVGTADDVTSSAEASQQASRNEDPIIANNPISRDDSVSGEASEDSDSEGWITPSNIKKKQADDAPASAFAGPEPKTMRVAITTTDFAMQNVILQMNLNLLSPSLQRIKHLKTFILRCHACFLTTKEMGRQFCPRCGKPTLTRVSCSTTAKGEFKLHLKKNMQWNNRGERYSVPKAATGSASGRITAGGGKGGWGAELILAEDQKEYVKAVTLEKRQKQRDLMDEDYLPSILTGERHRVGGRPKVGAGRNVNSRKR